MKSASITSLGIISVLSFATGCSSPAANSTSTMPQTATHVASPQQSVALKDLYVADYEVGTIYRFKNDGFTPDGYIKSGVSGPWGIALDRAGNVYVANATGPNITEYAPGATTPSFTYSTGMTSPRLVTVDAKGNVFETDFTDEYSQPGKVTEFPQGSNEPLYSCPMLQPWGVATDAAGDVFVAHNLANGNGGRVAEFKGGLAGCSSSDIGAQIGRAFGLAIDRHDNILLSDYNAGRIDIIAPPYTSITRHLKTGGGGPLFVAIDRSNKKVFASVPGVYQDKVFVIDYATGDVQTRLGADQHLDSAYGVADGPSTKP